MLPVQPRKKFRKPGKLLCAISYATWMMGIMAVISAIFLPEYTQWLFLPVFIFTVIQFFALRAFENQEDEDEENASLFEEILFWSRIVIGFLIFLCLASLLLIGGGPEMVDGDYCIVSHGDVVRYITPDFYRLMQTVESGFMAGLLYVFSPQMLLTCRERQRRG